MNISHLINKLIMVGAQIVSYNDFAILYKNKTDEYKITLFNDKETKTINTGYDNAKLNEHFVVSFRTDGYIIYPAYIFVKGSFENIAEKCISPDEFKKIVDYKLPTDNLRYRNNKFVKSDTKILWAINKSYSSIINYRGKVYRLLNDFKCKNMLVKYSLPDSDGMYEISFMTPQLDLAKSIRFDVDLDVVQIIAHSTKN